MKIRLELFNLITGFLLVITGLLNLYRGQFDIAAGWIIFGSMYLIMGNYMLNQESNSLLVKLTNKSRVIFSWVGLIASFLLLLYFLLYI